MSARGFPIEFSFWQFQLGDHGPTMNLHAQRLYGTSSAQARPRHVLAAERHSEDVAGVEDTWKIARLPSA